MSAPPLATLVLDTSALIDGLELVRALHAGAPARRVELLLPRTALKELDLIKDAHDVAAPLGRAARAAVNWLNRTLQTQPAETLRGQRPHEADAPDRRADDAILDCAVHSARTRCRPTFLLSRDRNLCLRARLEGLRAVDCAELATAPAVFQYVADALGDAMDLDAAADVLQPVDPFAGLAGGGGAGSSASGREGTSQGDSKGTSKGSSKGSSKGVRTGGRRAQDAGNPPFSMDVDSPEELATAAAATTPAATTTAATATSATFASATTVTAATPTASLAAPSEQPAPSSGHVLSRKIETITLESKHNRRATAPRNSTPPAATAAAASAGSSRLATPEQSLREHPLPGAHARGSPASTSSTASAKSIGTQSPAKSPAKSPGTKIPTEGSAAQNAKMQGGPAPASPAASLSASAATTLLESKHRPNRSTRQNSPQKSPGRPAPGSPGAAAGADVPDAALEQHVLALVDSRIRRDFDAESLRLLKYAAPRSYQELLPVFRGYQQSLGVPQKTSRDFAAAVRHPGEAGRELHRAARQLLAALERR